MARLKVVAKRPIVSEFMAPIFHVFAPRGSGCPLVEAEERTRLLALRRPVSAMIAVSEFLRSIFPDGKTATLPGKDPLPHGQYGMFRMLKLVYA
jgi:hypothetical protein